MKGRIELFGQAGLQLKNVTLSDTGVYQLFTVFSDGTSQTNNISVQVNDPCEENDCAPAVAVCVPEGFNFSCRCNSGYEGDDVNECATIPNLCAGGECRNTKGGYMCTCPNGFVINADGTKCIDNDECAMNGRLCENGQCLNIPGSYSCDCDMGLFAGFAFLVSTQFMHFGMMKKKRERAAHIHGQAPIEDAESTTLLLSPSPPVTDEIPTPHPTSRKIYEFFEIHVELSIFRWIHHLLGILSVLGTIVTLVLTVTTLVWNIDTPRLAADICNCTLTGT
ncbi:hypothetical protein Bbelb_157380 [Branchiostoma belcheri]|nr:hypothetical protein Bbelb_157380 [Branchiostoma belcheri]